MIPKQPNEAQQAASLHKPGSKRPKLIISILVVVLLAALVFAAVQFKHTRNQPTSSGSVTAKLGSSLQAALGRKDGLAVTFNEKTGLAVVTQTENLNQLEMSADNLRSSYSILVRTGEKFFKLDGVKSLEINERVSVTPQQPYAEQQLPEKYRSKPTPKVTNLVTIGMTKTNFQSVNWQGYVGKPVDKVITEKSYKYTINPTLKSLVKPDDLYLNR
jgi:hypothetical protein